MNQLDLLSGAVDPRPVPKRGRVPASSVAAYRSRARDGRITVALTWLSRATEPVTSAELAAMAYEGEGYPTLAAILETRRALSDALKLGLVEQGPSRPCQVSKGKGGRPLQCLTWRVVSR